MKMDESREFLKAMKAEARAKDKFLQTAFSPVKHRNFSRKQATIPDDSASDIIHRSSQADPEGDFHFVEVSADEFLHTVMPRPAMDSDITREKLEGIKVFDGIDADSVPARIYPALCKTFNQFFTEHEIPFFMGDTAFGEDPDGRDMVPGVCLYEKVDHGQEHNIFAIDKKYDLPLVPEKERVPYLVSVCWGWIVAYLEVHSDASSLPFNFDGAPLHLVDSPAAQATLAQMQCRAHTVLRRQFRTFCYSALLSQGRARLFRWDFTGAVVSESFDYLKDPAKLLTFVYRAAAVHSNGRRAGLDRAATRCSDSETWRIVVMELWVLLREGSWAFKHMRNMVENMFMHPVFHVTEAIEDEQVNLPHPRLKPRGYIVGDPRYQPDPYSSPDAYLAVSLDPMPDPFANRVFMFKDYFRAPVPPSEEPLIPVEKVYFGHENGAVAMYAYDIPEARSLPERGKLLAEGDVRQLHRCVWSG